MIKPAFAALAADVLTHCVAAVLVTFAATWGSLVGSPSAGIRRSPARASAPAARIEVQRAAGLTVRSDAPSSSPPHVGPDTATTSSPLLERGSGGQLAATTGETPSPVVAALQPAGA